MSSTDASANGISDQTSLQDAFQMFLESRKQQVARGRSARKGGGLDKQKLREEFLQRARKHLGVPYARALHDPTHCECEGCTVSGRQLYHDPTFLDCCGLVRRVAREMQASLGFRLGPGNQAYQFDTLPIRYEHVEHMQPGDLIFYSGTYNNPETKAHAFTMTHVEIFTGGSTGHATIGSRERHKWVMEYDDFQFTSARWKLTGYFFCSLEPWLEGRCIPQHPDLWLKHKRSQAPAASSSGIHGLPAWDAERHSIFASTVQEEDECDEPADG